MSEEETEWKKEGERKGGREGGREGRRAYVPLDPISAENAKRRPLLPSLPRPPCLPPSLVWVGGWREGGREGGRMLSLCTCCTTE